MPKPPKITPDPILVYMQGRSFIHAGEIIAKAGDNPNIMVEMAGPITVMSAFTSEVLLKCLLIMESNPADNQHSLIELFSRLRCATQNRIEQLWTENVIPNRKPMWDQIEAKIKERVPRDLRSALTAGRDAFVRLRYSYEGVKDVSFMLSDLPYVLRRVILELRPEWKNLRRTYQPLSTFPDR